MCKDEAIKQLQGMVVGAEWLSDSMVQALSVAIEALSAEVVEVVRCKDCKWYENNVCKRFTMNLDEIRCTQYKPDIANYCSLGERIEEQNSDN